MNLLPSRLRTYRKVIKNYFRYDDKDLDPVEYLALDDKKLLYIVISKVACTSIKATIGKNYGIQSNESRGLDIHTKKEWNRIFGKLNKPYSDYFKFTFVRNPFSRLVSCYNDRVITKTPDHSYHFKSYPISIPPNISFSDFIHRIVNIPDYLADRHFKSQSYSIYRNDTITPDFIGKLESLSEDWKKIANLFQLPDTIESLNKGTMKNTPEKLDFRTFYNPQLVAMVYEKYKQDIERFGYQKEYEDIRNFTDNS